MTVIDVWAAQPNPTFLAELYFDSLKKWTGQFKDAWSSWPRHYFFNYSR